jgi:predicted dienelactone hydrolase
VCDALWRDAARGRDVPVRIRIPEGDGKVPVILFSHGLGGSVDAGTTWGEAWSRNGFAVVHVQHPGSDASVWRDERGVADRLAAIRAAMTGEQLRARVADVGFVLEELGRLSVEGRCDLARIDRDRVGMSGHSFGAHTTQAVTGQTFPGVGERNLRDPRIRAAVAFSPAPPRGGDDAVRAAFASITLPFFSITGTEDEAAMLTDVTPDDRELPYRSMPAGDKYLLVFHGATHADLSGGGDVEDLAARRFPRRGARSGRRGAIDSGEHVDEVVAAATVAFWKAMLLGDGETRRFLEEGGVEAMLAAGDRYEWK